MPETKITYLVTNYNNANYLDECIKSILDQKNPNWKCIIVDDCSADHSLEVINHCAGKNEKIKIIQNPTNIGQIQSLINLLEIVDTEIVGVVDSDDAIHGGTTECILNAYATSPRIGMVYTNCIEYDENLKTPISLGQAERLPFGPASSIIFGYVSSLRTYRVSAYKQTSGYDLNLLYAEDHDLAYKLEEVCLPYYVNKCLYKYRYVATSRSRDESRKLELLWNHRQAKLNAIERRLDSSLDKWLCQYVVNFEYKAKLSKFRKNSFSKNIYNTLHRVAKWILQKKMFKIIDVKNTI